jgi:mannosyltransferase OCH1-like enzyme
MNPYKKKPFHIPVTNKFRRQNDFARKKNNMHLHRISKYPLKGTYHPIIPQQVFQTWYTKNLPPKMKKNNDLLKLKNPAFQFHLYDDNDCREFIKENFEPQVLEAYNKLKPGAYKADLWRLCILYKMGGVYLDIKINCINGFRLIELTENEHFVKDRPGPLSIYNAVMSCQAGNPLLLMAINKIVQHTKTRYYGPCCLSVTGPIMLGDLILKNKIRVNIDMRLNNDAESISYKGHHVLSTNYEGYNEERTIQYNLLHTKRYDRLWSEKNIYN